jgi:Carbohydrate-selective porin, OprB family/S-layer homology domain
MKSFILCSVESMQWRSMLVLSSVLSSFALAGLAPAASANTNLDLMAASSDEAIVAVDEMSQVTSVSQLSDVKPTDWAFQALQSLVERYGCIAGYPDKTYRGNRAMTRYEFAAGLNACMDRVNDLIAASTADSAKKEDLATIRKLQEQFSAELATLRGRVDGLEGKVATLEKQQFSTTTKLIGQVILGIQGRSSNKATTPNSNGVAVQDDPGSGLTMGYNANLSLVTAFSPKSMLLVGLQAGNLTTNPSNNYDTGLSYEGDTRNQLIVSDLTYRQMLGKNFAMVVGAEGLNAINVFRGANRVESAGFGPISALAQRNPIVALGAGRAGAGFDWQIAPRISLQGVYSAGEANSPTPGSGLFNGPYSLGAQLSLAPTTTTDLAIQYINAYSNVGLTNMVGEGVVSPGLPTSSNAIGASAAWRISPKVTLGGWAGYTRSTVAGLSGGVDTFNWMTYLNLPDLGGKGNLAGLYIGQPPRITSSDLPAGLNIPGIDADGTGNPGGRGKSTTHIEAFYRMRISDRIAITPGMMVILNPAGSNSDTIFVGALRTTFSF